ncbi:MAG: hypothetical protein Kilf2KO_48970 [Rhodospirillales bacterium]
MAQETAFDAAYLKPILKDALKVGGICLLLTLFMVGVRTVDNPQGLQAEYRFDDVVTAVIIVFIGRIALSFIQTGRILAGLAVTGGFSLWMLIALLTLDADNFGALPKPFASAIVCWIVTLAALGFSLRGLFLLLRGDKGLPATLKEGGNLSIQRLTPWIGAAFIMVAFVLPWFDFADRRVMDMAVLVLTYVMLGWGLNIVVGLAGLLDLGYVAFYAVGAYTFALTSFYFDFGFWLALPVCGAMAAFFGVMLGFPVLRLRGDYLAIVTLGFGEIIRVILINWWWFTGGPDGIRGIPRPTLFGLEFTRRPKEGQETFHSYFDLDFNSVDRIIFLYYIILVMALITNAFSMRMRRLPVGRAWEALREDEVACRALGINPVNTKLTAFGLGAMFGGLAGCFFATRQGFISPESFTFIESAVILAIVVLGGLGSQVGVVIASILLIGVPELFRELQEYRMLAFGGGMVLVMVWRPRGLLSHRDPTVRLFKGRRSKSARPSEGTA